MVDGTRPLAHPQVVPEEEGMQTWLAGHVTPMQGSANRHMHGSRRRAQLWDGCADEHMRGSRKRAQLWDGCAGGGAPPPH